MDEKTQMMISLGAAVAANCIPCFEHLHHQAKKIDISDETIHDIVDIASRVKNGAHIALKGSIDEIMGLSDKTGDLNPEPAQACGCGCVS